MVELKLLRGHTVLVSSIEPDSLVIDCGSHRGEFSREILNISPVEIHGFEANPDLFAQLPKLENVFFFNKAIAGFDGEISFNIQEPERGSVRFADHDNNSVSVECTQIETHLNDLVKDGKSKRINLLKLDIEGAELDVLEAASLELIAKIDQITVEFHDFLCKEDIPRIRNCVRKLKNSGFVFFRFSFFTWGDCLFINPKHTRVSFMDRMLIYYHKYFNGFSRITKKLLKKKFDNNIFVS